MEQEVLRHRNAVFNRIYYSSLTLYKTCIPSPLRWLLELYFLVLAIAVLFLWGYVHFTYIVSSEDCLVNITDRPFPRDAILQVEVYSNTTEIWSQREKSLHHRYNKLYRSQDSDTKSMRVLTAIWIRDYCESNMIVNLTGTNYFCQLLLAELVDFTEAEHSIEGDRNMESLSDAREVLDGSPEQNVCIPDRFSDLWINDELGVCVSKTSFNIATKKYVEEELNKAVFYSKNYTLFDLFDLHSLRVLSMDYIILEFSQEPGYLSLTAHARSRLNISVVKKYIDPDMSTCFGGPFGQFMTKYFLGYDMMVISSFKGLLSTNRESGYVKNLLTGSQYYYRVQWMGKWRYGAGLLPALFFTLVASVLLRRIHYHVFKFLTHFHHLLNQGVPMPIQTGAQIPFLIVTYATIGLVIVMSEALSDDSVFSLLMVGTVWEVDQFYSIYCKQETSKIYLPWFFFLYHFLPYAYYIRFNGQFWFIPFLFHWLLLQHAILFFLHHCELPSLDRPNRVNVMNLHLQPPARPPLVPDREDEQNVNLEETEVVNFTSDDHLQNVEENTVMEEGSGVGLHTNEDHLPHVEENRVTEEGSGVGLMRPQLHKMPEVNNDGVSSSIVLSSQDSGSQSGKQQQLSDEELRKIRLQHFEKK